MKRLCSLVFVALLIGACTSPLTGNYASDQATGDQLVDDVLAALQVEESAVSVVLDGIDMRLCPDSRRSVNLQLEITSPADPSSVFDALLEKWSSDPDARLTLDDEMLLLRREDGATTAVLSPSQVDDRWLFDYTGPCRTDDPANSLG